ncbi:hypothetical protein ACFLY6_02475 [Candidatus Dependentiae bacterium]
MISIDFHTLIQALSKLVFFVILISYIVKFFRIYVIPKVEEGFLDNLCLWKQLGDDYQACLLEKKQKDNELLAQCEKLKEAKKKLTKWRKKLLDECSEKSMAQSSLVEGWDDRQNAIEVYEADVAGRKSLGKDMLQSAHKKIKRAMEGRVGEKNFEVTLKKLLNEEISVSIFNDLKGVGRR